jgi:serine/threonine protein kinase
VLTDFGLSKVTEGLNKAAGSSTSNAGAGTLRWKAPELFRTSTSGTVTLASDVWAFGCTAYQVYPLFFRASFIFSNSDVRSS